MQVSILGCGWLGLPLAKALIAEGYIIKGSTTTEAKLNILQKESIEPFLVSLSEGGPAGDIISFLKGSDVLIIDIPPKVKGGESYPDKIRCLVAYIEKAQIKKVIFISSTSVYAAATSEVTEETMPQPDTESGRQVLEAEKVLQETTPFQTTIVRFGGLISEDRHPVKHLAGRENIVNPDAPVNLIHRNDCIGIIKAIIEKGAWGEVFNGVAPYHPTRNEYYTAKAKELGLEVPVFNHSKTSTGKIIFSIKLQHILNYNFTASI